MNIAHKYKKWFILSAIIIIVGMGFAFINGLNLGIDFTGGTMLRYEFEEKIEIDKIKDVLTSYDLDEEIIHAGSENQEVIIRTSKKSLSNDQRIEISEKFEEKLNGTFLGAEQFSSSVGNEIRQKAFTAILLAGVCMLIYIWFRFELLFGFASIIALIHDVLILLAVYAIFNIPVNSSFIAAILTVVGYSINDTIVVFDRIRENIRRKKSKNNFEIASLSIDQTILRSIFTSLTTLLVIGSLFVLGTPSIKEFATPLLAGVLAGTYSSIFIASPVWAILKTKKS
ncbi:MAG: protein translocase subunit SecF [Bacillota bacterium]